MAILHIASLPRMRGLFFSCQLNLVNIMNNYRKNEYVVYMGVYQVLIFSVQRYKKKFI